MHKQENRKNDVLDRREIEMEQLLKGFECGCEMHAVPLDSDCQTLACVRSP